MTSLTGLSPNNPLGYTGAKVALATVVTRNRAPTGADYKQPETGKLYPFNTLWLVGKDPTTGTQGDLWYLSKIVANVAYWVMLSNGGLDADSFQVQAATAPGVNPVTPTAIGLVNVNATTVANHSVPIETHTRVLNTYNIEAQIATSAAATDATKNGLSHYDSAIFTVDANGFVSLPNAAVSWTPVLRFGGANTGITYSAQTGSYWKIGKLVHFVFQMALTSKGSDTGFCTITGLPFSSASDQTFAFYTQAASFPAGTSSFIAVLGGASSIILPYGQASASTTQLADTNFTDTTVIQMSGFYWEA